MPSPARFLLGPADRRRSDSLLAVAVFAATFAAYALGAFAVRGGVVFLPRDAALVAVVAAGVRAYRGSGLLFGWVLAAAALLGASADHYLLGLSGRAFAARLAALLELDGLAFLAVQSLVLGTGAWAVGTLCRWVVRHVGDGGQSPERD